MVLDDTGEFCQEKENNLVDTPSDKSEDLSTSTAKDTLAVISDSEELAKLIEKLGGIEGLKRIEKLIPLVEQAGGKGSKASLTLVESAMRTIINGKFQEKIAQDYIKDMVLDRINNDKIKPFTQGQEGEIFKIKLFSEGEEKEYIVAKRHYRGRNNGKHEYDFQHKAYDILKHSAASDAVFVPKPISYFQEGETEFVIMEYIKGKTLYCLLMEHLVTNMLRYYKKELGEDGDYKNIIKKYGSKKFKSLHLNEMSDEKSKMKQFRNQHCDKVLVGFEHDGEAATVVYQLLEMIAEFSNYFKNALPKKEYAGLNPHNNKDKAKIMELLTYKYLAKCDLFQEKEAIWIKKKMRLALSSLHNNGVYHRDLAGNPRNLMFTYDGDIAIIDFGNATDVDDYTNIDESGRYLNDNSIMTVFNGLIEEEKSDTEKYFEALRKEEKIRGLLSDEDIDSILSLLGLTEGLHTIIKPVTPGALKMNVEYNLEKDGEREHYIYLKNESGHFLSKREAQHALLHGTDVNNDKQKKYFLASLLAMTKDDFDVFDRFIAEQLSSLSQRRSVKRIYLEFYKHIIDTVKHHISK